MQNALSRLVETLTLPLLLLAGAYLLQSLYAAPLLSLQPLINYLPYAIFAVGALLCTLFGRSRVLYLLLLLSVSYWAFSSVLQHARGAWDKTLIEWVFNTTCLLVPINALAIVYLPERGATSPYALLRYALLCGQIVLVWWLTQHAPFTILEWLTRIYVMPLNLEVIHVAQLSLLAMLVAVLGIAALALRNPTPINSAILAATMAFAISSNWLVEPGVLVIFHTIAGLILTVGVILDSHNMAYLDELTGIPGRRALNEQLTALGRHYAIAMLDVDHFKKFNDTYGHDVGDQVLRMVAAQIQRVGGRGKAFRYGGEEFSIIFPNKSVKEAMPHLERVRHAIETYEMKLRSQDRPAKPPKKPKPKAAAQTVSVTISIGVAERNDTAKTPEAVIKAADEALYRAKKGGRNQVSV